MAIVVEENKGKSGFISFLVWLLIIALVGVAVYYVFFKNPAIVENLSPAAFQNTAALSKINLRPEAIVNSPDFRSLKQYIAPPAAQNAGRPNPFLSF